MCYLMLSVLNALYILSVNTDVRALRFVRYNIWLVDPRPYCHEYVHTKLYFPRIYCNTNSKFCRENIT